MVPLAAPAQGWDEILFYALNLAGTNPIADALMIAITTLGGTYVIALVAVPLWLRGEREATFDLLLLLAITVFVTTAIKYAVDRPRPCLLPDVRTLVGYGCSDETDPSFPSGHASRAFALAGLISLRFRWRVGGPAFGFAFLVGLSRIYLGVHWPSDVLGGALLGIGLALLIELVARRSSLYRRVRSKILGWIPHLRRDAAT